MEGYWLTHYRAGPRHGEGLVMLHAGELLGGDLEHIWRGTYEEEEGRLLVRIRIVPFVSREEEETMARERPIILTLTGSCTENTAHLEGCPDAHDDLFYDVEMRRCRSLQSEEHARAA